MGGIDDGKEGRKDCLIVLTCARASKWMFCVEACDSACEGQPANQRVDPSGADEG